VAPERAVLQPVKRRGVRALRGDEGAVEGGEREPGEPVVGRAVGVVLDGEGDLRAQPTERHLAHSPDDGVDLAGAGVGRLDGEGDQQAEEVGGSFERLHGGGDDHAQVVGGTPGAARSRSPAPSASAARAHVAQPEVNVGIIPGAGGTPTPASARRPRGGGGAVHHRRVLQADEALRLVRLNAVLRTDRFGDHVHRWCSQITRNPAGAVFAAKRAVVDGLPLPPRRRPSPQGSPLP
jgi:hypothetical protein